jgi:2'-5' RNA ligase
VAKQRLKSPRARLFVALDLPDEVRDGLARWQGSALADDALRPMRPEALHVTLVFLGYQAERAIPRIAEVLAAAGPRPVELRFDPDPSPIPKGRPRLYAVGGRSDSASSLQAELSDAFEKARLYKPEKRPFWPHVTVARVRSERQAPERGERRGRARPKRVKRAPAKLPEELREPFAAARLSLYRSLLKPAGAEYARLHAIELPSDAAG